MPKLIDYPRTSYTGAWEIAEIVDDTGGKCAVETAAKKLNRKVSGSFKAIIGSAVKFGLMTSKRDLLTNTTLFRRIKHAYDKTEELQFHQEAFLTPPLFTQLCRKFRNRELPVQMLDVMLIREFGVEEINAQNVAKAFVDGCRMCRLLDERNIIGDIDSLNSTRVPRRELASAAPTMQTFGVGSPETKITPSTVREAPTDVASGNGALGLFSQPSESFFQNAGKEPERPQTADAIASLFGLPESTNNQDENHSYTTTTPSYKPRAMYAEEEPVLHKAKTPDPGTVTHNIPTNSAPAGSYQMQMSGPGVNTSLDITDEADLSIAIALLEKIRRQLRTNS